MTRDRSAFGELVDPVHSALVVIDLQNDFCSPKGAIARRGLDVSGAIEIAPRLVRLVEGARSIGAYIVHVQNTHSQWTDSLARKTKWKNDLAVTVRDTWGAEFFEDYPELQPRRDSPTEYHVVKHRYSAFIDTDLDLFLRSHEIRTIMLGGVQTNLCVESTARDGYMYDYNVVMLADCTASNHREREATTLANISDYFGTVATSDEVLAVWGLAPAQR